MSAQRAVRAALVAALRADPTLSGELNGLYDGPPVKASAPWGELGELLGVDWSTKDRAGRELRLALTLRDAGESAERLETLAAAASTVIEALPRAIGGWDVASVVPVRSRIGGSAPGRWSATLEYRVRVLAHG